MYKQAQHDIQDVIGSICNIHVQQNGIACVCLTGSYGNQDPTHTKNSKPGDIDFLILYYKGHKQTIVRKLFGSYAKYGIHKIDDAHRFIVNNTEISVVYKEYDSFLSLVKKIVCGKYTETNRVRSVGGYMPEVLINDIMSCSVLYDNTQQKNFRHIQQYISAHSADMMQRLSTQIKQELDYKVQYIASHRTAYFNIVLLGDLVKQYIRYTCLQRGRFCKGIKHEPPSIDLHINQDQQSAIKDILHLLQNIIYNIS